MKRLYILLLPVFLFNTSCHKFLEQTSQDLIRPETVEHYKELLQGEGYFKDFYKNGWFVDMMTDDIDAFDLGYPTTNVNAKLEFVKYAYLWGADLEDPTGTFTDKLFQTLYKNILPANACLEAVDGVKGTDAERKVLKGQAYFTRAYGYFVLANLYAQAYNQAKDNDLCVPLILDTKPTLKGYNRATIKEVWDLIADDIEKAVLFLKDDITTRSVYEINYKAALLLATRVFLFKEDFRKVISYGEQFMQTNPSLKDITTITSSPTRSGAGVGTKAFLYYGTNDEIIFTFSRLSTATGEGSYLYYSNESTGISQTCFVASNGTSSSLMDCYTTKDKRKTYWFAQPSGTYGSIFSQPYYSPMKVNFYDLCRTSQSMRTAEVFLNLAEAYARQPTTDANRSIELLNQLRNNRIEDNASLTVDDFSGNGSLVKFIWEERRRELCFEEFHRWWDLRRTGQPVIEHTLLGETYELKEKDPAYILNFPKEEREFNPGLVPNNRPTRKAK